MIRHKGNASRRSEPLSSGLNVSKKALGTLEFTIGYYPKMNPPGTPEGDASNASKADLAAKQAPMAMVEDTVMTTPPSPLYPSGLLSVQIHEIRDLSLKPTRGTYHSHSASNWESADREDIGDTDEWQEDAKLPSSYCTMYGLFIRKQQLSYSDSYRSVNDEMIYKTGIKPITSTPFFNAGTERFIRDWRTTHITVTVRDSRMRENDPILGIAVLKASSAA